MEYFVNHQKITYTSQGEARAGDDTVLVQHAVDLTADTSWHSTGYTIAKLFDNALYNVFKDNTRKLLLELWQQAGLTLPAGFLPEQYHRLVTAQEIHLKTVDKTKLIQVERFPVAIRLLEERISAICGKELEVRNPYDGQRVYHFRVIRPNSGDNNPLHRDVWLEDYDDCINLYIPVCGSNPLSSLILAPGSHLWPESAVERTVGGAFINNVRFNVPAVTAIHGDYKFIRPDPLENEVLVFSPYLVHGGAVNLNTDITRISIEVRLWKK